MFLRLLLLCSFIFVLVVGYADENQRPENGAFQYQYSFSGPFGGTHIPFWETGGSAVVTDNYVRLTPNRQSQRGSIWTLRPMRNRDWEMHVQFSVGSDARLGADGMAVWYTKERGQTGPVMGNTDRWSGLGIIIDTFDNDGQRDNPQIYALYNDNTFAYNPATDGKDKTLGICQASVRQINPTPETKSAKILIRVKERTLFVAYDLSGLTSTETGWTECFSVPLPLDDQTSGYFLGVTGETGGLHDYHDVKSVNTWSLRSPRKDEPPTEEAVPDYKRKIEEATKSKETKDPRDARDARDPNLVKEVIKETVYKRKLDNDDPAAEIVNRLFDLEKRDEAFSTNFETKFKEVHQKLEAIERDQLQTLTKLLQGLESIRSTIDVKRFEELQTDVKSALAALHTVTNRVNNIEGHVEGTSKKTQDLHGLHEARSTELKELVESSTTWGFWTYFLIFQFLFWGAFVWWKRSQDDKSKKFL